MVARFLFCALFAASQLSAEPAVKLFGGWIAGCNNENICTAIRPVWDAIDGLPLNDGMPFVQIRHHPQRGSAPEITLIDQSNPAPDAILKPPLAAIMIHYDVRDKNYNCRGSCVGHISLFQAHIDGKGGYRIKDEDARSVLYGLRQGIKVEVSLGDRPALPLDTAKLDEALAHFDREQELEDTPGALVLRPENVMYDYAHPVPPEAETVVLTAFSVSQLNSWRVEYPESMPGETIYSEPDLSRGTVLLVRARSPDGDCGILEQWGHVGAGNDFALFERREMPVCNGIAPQHWIQTYRANRISPE